MQDRFKFRAILHQDKYEEYGLEKFKNQRIFDVQTINVGCENSTIVIIADYPNGDWAIREINEKDIDLIQCTGLKDKNGKLIYEGDIVRFKDCNDILVVNYQKEMACFAPQFYCNGEYGGRLWFDDYDSFECQFYKSDNFEVIGNIHEDKELLQ